MPEQEYKTRYVFENHRTGELKYDPQILLHTEDVGEVNSDDIAELLYCDYFFTSKKLRLLWAKGFLKRRRSKPVKRGRPNYIYELTEKGESVCDLLHKKGY